MTRLFNLDCGLVLLEGDDTRRFLNSMLTNNFKDLAVGDGNHNAITDRKGKVEGLLDGYMLSPSKALLVLNGMDIEWTLERLDMYIIMDPIELTELSLTHGVLSLQGPEARTLAEAAGLPVPEVAVARIEGGWVLFNDRVDDVGLDIILPSEQLEVLRTKLLELGAKTGSNEDLEGLRIQRGLPRWPADMGKRAFVHELGLRDRVCSFRKGCYVGQEVINRMDTMGKLNRRLLRVRMDSSATPGPIEVDGKPAGEITSVGRVDGQFWGLGLLRAPAWEPGTRVARGGVDGTIDPS